MKLVIAVLNDFGLINSDAVFRGKSGQSLKMEFDPAQSAVSVKDKLVEALPDGTVVFRKPGETTKTSHELKKEGKPPGKVPPKKTPKETPKGK